MISFIVDAEFIGAHVPRAGSSSRVQHEPDNAKTMAGKFESLIEHNVISEKDLPAHLSLESEWILNMQFVYEVS